MQPRTDLTKVIGSKRYSVAKATRVASDVYADGRQEFERLNAQRHKYNTFLYRTPRGNYFTVTVTEIRLGSGSQVDVENDLVPVSLDDAIELYRGPLRSHHQEFAEAFPGVVVEDA